MRTLVIDTATTACSVALIDDGAVVARRHEVVGRGHAERLVPMIAELPGGGRADRILVDVGPGSFTGVRVGIAAARGLAFGWSVPVRGYSSLALVAAAAFARHPREARIAVVIEAGHGELFMQLFDPSLGTPMEPRSMPPAVAVAAIGDALAIGSGIGRLPDTVARTEDALPDAADVPLLPTVLVDLPPAPLYGRAPDAKLPGGRSL